MISNEQREELNKRNFVLDQKIAELKKRLDKLEEIVSTKKDEEVPNMPDNSYGE